MSADAGAKLSLLSLKSLALLVHWKNFRTIMLHVQWQCHAGQLAIHHTLVMYPTDCQLGQLPKLPSGPDGSAQKARKPSRRMIEDLSFKFTL